MKQPTKTKGNEYAVYGLVNPRTRNIRYVGLTTDSENRKSKHKKRYPYLNFQIIGECESEAEMCLWEWLFIELLRPPLNTTAGGGTSPMKDPKISAKMAATKRRKYANGELDLSHLHGENSATKDPKIAAKVGTVRKRYLAEHPDKHPMKDPKTRAKVSAAMKKYFAENPDKIHMKGKTGERHHRSKPVVCNTTGERFLSGLDAARITRIPHGNISKCINGKAKSAGKLPDGTPLEWVLA